MRMEYSNFQSCSKQEGTLASDKQRMAPLFISNNNIILLQFVITIRIIPISVANLSLSLLVLNNLTLLLNSNLCIT